MTPEERQKSKIPVTLITGFLGSGKTTLLNKLLQHPEFAKTLVIINEFGEIGIDHALLVESQEDVVLEMDSGCMCCTIRGDLKRTLHDAPWRYARDGKCWFERVVIETTGLADPLPIIHTLMMDPLVEAMYDLAGVVTTVDAMAALSTLDRQEEAVRQIAVADMVLLTKTDLADQATVDQVTERIRALNPAAPLEHTRDGVIDPARLTDPHLHMPVAKGSDVEKWLNAEAYEAAEEEHHHHHHDHDHDDHDDHDGHDEHAHHHDVNRHDEHIRAQFIRLDHPIPYDVFEQWMEILLEVRGPDMLRVKGLIGVIGHKGPAVIHGVQHVFHPPQFLDAWPDEDHTGRIVFIGRDLPVDDFRKGLEMIEYTAKEKYPELYEG